MSSVRTRLFKTESFRLAAVYAGLFFGSMTVLIVLIYFIVARAFETDLIEDSNDDLASIRKAYTAELSIKPNKAVHEAKEMIDDRLLAGDKDDVFLLQKGARTAPCRQPSGDDAEGGPIEVSQSAAIGRRGAP